VKGLAGKRVLLVEDEPIVAMDVEDMLLELGCEVIGPCPRLSAALEAAHFQSIDVAVLDVNLNGEESYPVAQALRDRSIPFAFATGFGERKTPFPEAPTLTKPYGSQQLEAALVRALEGPDTL
jgi:DNA-binding response OmpR family regulator